MKRAALVALLPLMACTSSLPFNFAFTQSASHDLAVTSDLAVASGDLAVSAHDLIAAAADLTVDQAVQTDLGDADLATGNGAVDLKGQKDLRLASDLTSSDLLQSTPDLIRVLSELGGPCVTFEDCAGGAACFKSLKVNDINYDLPDGYCSFTCDVTGTDVACLAAGGHCRFTTSSKSQSLCVRDCGEYCPAGRNTTIASYACCTFQASPDGPQADVGCLPTTFDDIAGFACVAPTN